MPKKKTKAKEFTVTLELASESFRGDGATILEALNEVKNQLGKAWVKIKLKGILYVTDRTKSCEKVFYRKQLRMIFTNNLTRELWAKRLELLLNANE